MEAQVLTQARGINGTLQLLPDRIRILREGWISNLYGRHKRTELLLEQILTIEFKLTAGGLGGYLAFHDDSGREDFEDFCVSFLKPQELNFAALYQAIEEKRTDVQEQLEPMRLAFVPQERLI